MRRYFITAAGIAGSGIIVVIIILIVQFYSGKPFWKALPAVPQTGSIPPPVLDQIANERKKIFFLATSNALGRLGMIYHSCSDYTGAAICYNLALKKNNDRWVWNYYLGVLNTDQGQSSAAISHFKKVLEKDPSNIFAIFHTAEAYQKSGAPDSAMSLYHSIAEASLKTVVENKTSIAFSFPLRTYILFQIARIHMDQGRYDSAAAILNAIIAEEETFGPAYRSLATIYQVAGDTSAAKKMVTRANDLPDYLPPRDSLMDEITMLSRSDQYLLKQVEDALRSRDSRRALVLCDHALQYYPDNKELISTIVFENLRQGNDQLALSYLGKHFDYFSNDAKELMDVMDLLYDRKHLDAALLYFNQVKKLLPQNSDLVNWLFERGKKDEAITMMADLRRENPDNPKIMADQIRMLLSLGEDATARQLFTRLSKKYPAGFETQKIKGLLAEKQGAIDSAASAYETANRLEPDDLALTRQLIAFYIVQKEWQPAISHFRSALERFPNEPFLLEGLGRLLISCPDRAQKNIQEGIEYSKRALTNYRSTTGTMLSAGKTLATTYLLLGNKKLCIQYINTTIRLADEVHESAEYTAYFKALIAKK